MTVSDRRRGLGRGLGALIPTEPARSGSVTRPSDVFFREDRPSNPYGLTPDASRGTTVSAPTSADPAGTSTEVTVATQVPESPVVNAPMVEPVSATADNGVQLAEVPGATFALIGLDEIRTNPRQPREVFDDDELAELAHSITEIGVLQPVVVRRVDAGDVDSAQAGDVSESDAATAATGGSADAPTTVRYELVMGERRLRASRLAGETSIPAIIKDTPDDAMLRDALLENLHRSQLNPLEEAAAYQQLLDDFGCTHEELASRIGRSRPQITNIIRLLRLPPLVARRVAAGVLSAGHARALLGLPDAAAMERLAQRIVAEGLSVRSVEEIVSMGVDDAPARRTAPRTVQPRPELDDAAARLADRLDTRVSISMGRRKGKVTVEFASVEDLDRILGALGETPTESPDHERLAG